MSERPNGREMARLLAEFVNRMSTSMSDDEMEFVEVLTKNTHRTLQQSAFQLMLKAIRAWAELPDSMYDRRNEATVKACRLMWQSWQDEIGPTDQLPFI